MPDTVRWSSPNPVEPGARDWEVSDPPDPDDFAVPKPPGNGSSETVMELAELRQMTANRTPEDIAEIKRWSVEEPSPNTHWCAIADQVTQQYRLSPPAAARVYCLLNSAIFCAMVAAWHEKWRYLRPRPDQLDPSIDVSVIPVPQHPAYPAGHSTVAGAAKAVLSRLFPAEAARFDALAEESGISRLKAGIHYRSDHTAGLRLGEAVARRCLREAHEDGAPRRYLLQAGSPPGEMAPIMPQGDDASGSSSTSRD